MKQKLRLWASYGLKRTQPEYLLCLQSLLKVRYILTGYVALMLRKRTYAIVHYPYFTSTLPVLETRSSFLRTFFSLCSNFIRAVCVLDVCRMRKNLTYRTHTACKRHARWANTGRSKAEEGGAVLRRLGAAPCSSQSSLIFHPCDIPMIPVHISAKRPKDGLLSRGIRQTYEKNAHSDRERVGQGPRSRPLRVGFGSASEISLRSMLPCTALRLAAPNGVQSERKINPAEDQTKHPSHPEGDSVRRWSAGCPLTARDWFEYSGVLVRQLFACASAFSRSVAEGLSKASRTLVEALSKDCRTSLEQQSNNCRRNNEESCVCTHAKAPSRSGLGLALGLVFLTMCLQVFAKYHDDSLTTAENYAQRHILTGIIKSAATDMPIEGAMIQIKGTNAVAFSNIDGRFSIQTTVSDGVVEVSFSDYELITRGFHDGAIKRGEGTFFLKRDVSNVPELVIGDSIPESFWDMPLDVVNHPEGRSIITLREYQHRKLLVLDFWATYCSPCIETIDAWETVIEHFPDDIAYLTVYVDFQHRALPFIRRRGWKSPAIVGEAHWSINRYFFKSYQLGGVVMIYQGKLFAIPENKGYDIEKLHKLLAGKRVEFESDTVFAHHRKEGMI